MVDAKFITLEGGEGSGKTTQARLLAEHLRRLGKDVLLTREPGGTPRAELIRDVILSGKAKRFGPLAETVLLYAARESHLELAIRPALKRGTWVICDRFSDSTRAYQGAGSGVDKSFIEAIDAAVVGSTKPDLTLIFDVSPEVGLQRALERQKQAIEERALQTASASPKADLQGEPEAADRFESMSYAFHELLRDEFMQIANEHPERCVVIDASKPVDVVARQVRLVVNQRCHF